MFQVSQNGGHISRSYTLQRLQIIPLASQELYSELVSAKLSYGKYMSTVSLSGVFEGKEHACAGGHWVVFPGVEVWLVAMVTMHVADNWTVHSS